MAIEALPLRENSGRDAVSPLLFDDVRFVVPNPLVDRRRAAPASISANSPSLAPRGSVPRRADCVVLPRQGRTDSAGRCCLRCVLGHPTMRRGWRERGRYLGQRERTEPAQGTTGSLTGSSVVRVDGEKTVSERSSRLGVLLPPVLLGGFLLAAVAAQLASLVPLERSHPGALSEWTWLRELEVGAVVVASAVQALLIYYTARTLREEKASTEFLIAEQRRDRRRQEVAPPAIDLLVEVREIRFGLAKQLEGLRPVQTVPPPTSAEVAAALEPRSSWFDIPNVRAGYEEFDRGVKLTSGVREGFRRPFNRLSAAAGSGGARHLGEYLDLLEALEATIKMSGVQVRRGSSRPPTTHHYYAAADLEERVGLIQDAMEIFESLDQVIEQLMNPSAGG